MLGSSCWGVQQFCALKCASLLRLQQELSSTIKRDAQRGASLLYLPAPKAQSVFTVLALTMDYWKFHDTVAQLDSEPIALSTSGFARGTAALYFTSEPHSTGRPCAPTSAVAPATLAIMAIILHINRNLLSLAAQRRHRGPKFSLLPCLGLWTVYFVYLVSRPCPQVVTYQLSVYMYTI